MFSVEEFLRAKQKRVVVSKGIKTWKKMRGMERVWWGRSPNLRFRAKAPSKKPSSEQKGNRKIAPTAVKKPHPLQTYRQLSTSAHFRSRLLAAPRYGR